MMLKLLLMITLLQLMLTGNCQLGEKITYEKSFIGYKFYVGTAPLKPRMMKMLMVKDPRSYELIRSALLSRGAHHFLLLAGAGLIAVPFLDLTRSHELAIGLAATGAALWAISLPFYADYKKNSAKSVEQYNTYLDRQVSEVLELSTTSDGLTLTWRF